MKSILLKRWFLLLVAFGLGLAWLVPDYVRPWTHALQPRFLVAIALFLMAWGLESRQLFFTLLKPLPALWAVLISYGALPALAWLAGWLLPEADFRVGLLISASVPCTLASAVLWTRLAGGSEATALLVILLTTCSSWLVTTAWLYWGTGAAVSLDQGDMMRGLLLVLVLPVGLGQASRAVQPLARLATRQKRAIGILAQLLILSVILKAAVDVFDRLGERSVALSAGALVATACISVGTHVSALFGGLWSSRAWGWDRPSQIAVAISCSQKTLPVALFLYEVYFKSLYPLAVVPMVFYHVGQLIVDTFIADSLARQAQRQPNLAEAVV